MDVAMTPEDFTAWHVAECAARGIPRPGRRASDGQVMIDAQWTTAWVEPHLALGDGRVVVSVPDALVPLPAGAEEVLVEYPHDDLGGPTEATVTVGGVPEVASVAVFDAQLPLPAEVVVDGVTYAVPGGVEEM